MQGFLPPARPSSTDISRKSLRHPERNFGRVARAIWPRKTAAELAARAGATQRTAEFWLAGHEPSARALAVIIDELLR